MLITITGLTRVQRERGSSISIQLSVILHIEVLSSTSKFSKILWREFCNCLLSATPISDQEEMTEARFIRLRK